MIRGGSWNNKPANLRSANRNRNNPDNRNNNLGFRLVHSACQSQEPPHLRMRRAWQQASMSLLPGLARMGKPNSLDQGGQVAGLVGQAEGSATS